MNWLDSAINLLDRAYDSMADTVGDWSEAWQRQVDNFKSKAREFLSLYVRLSERSELAAKDPTTKADYDAWMNKAGYIRRIVEEIANKLDWSINTLMAGNSSQMGAMGAPILIPIAVIAAALAAITAALSSGYKLNQQLDAIERATDSEGKLDDKLLSNLFAQDNGFLPSTATLATVGVVGAMLYWWFRSNKNGR